MMANSVADNIIVYRHYPRFNQFARGIIEEVVSFSHEHVLSLVDASVYKIKLDKPCWLCGEAISLTNSPLVATCLMCDEYLWHKTCLQLPQHIQHPFHPHHTLTQTSFSYPNHLGRCTACYRLLFQYAYRCSEDGYTLDFACAALTPSATSPSITIPAHHKLVCPLANKNIRHTIGPHYDPLAKGNIIWHTKPHYLILCDVNYTTYHDLFCSICGNKFPKQVVLVKQEAALYVCHLCKIAVHGRCARLLHLLPSTITNHPLFPDYTMYLSHHLFARGEDPYNHINFGGLNYYYKNSDDEFCFLPPILATSTYNTSVVGEQKQHQQINTIINASTTHIHRDGLIYLNYHPNEFLNMRCFACGEAITKEADVISFCQECRVFLHESCSTLPRQMQHPCHLKHPLTLYDAALIIADKKPAVGNKYVTVSHFLNYSSSTTTRSRREVAVCVACRCIIEGYSYECHSCHFYLHIKCATESSSYPPIKSEIHPHSLVYFKSTNSVARKSILDEGVRDEADQIMVDEIDDKIVEQSVALDGLEEEINKLRPTLLQLTKQVAETSEKLNRLVDETATRSAELDQLKHKRAQLLTH